MLSTTTVRYGGDYAKVLDLVRLTVVCHDLDGLFKAFRAIVARMPVVRAKNRLCKVYDATASGGYRDLMLNVADAETRHVCEVQLTLSAFMQAKNSGGHAMYKVMRLIGRLDESMIERQGRAEHQCDHAGGRLEDGAYSVWDCSGSPGSVVIARLVPSLLSPRCFLTKLVLNAVSGLGSLADTALR